MGSVAQTSCLSTRTTDMKDTHATPFPAEPDVCRAGVLISLKCFAWTLGKGVFFFWTEVFCHCRRRASVHASVTCGALNCTALCDWICIVYLYKGPSLWCLMLCIKVYIRWHVAAAIVCIVSCHGMYHLRNKWPYCKWLIMIAVCKSVKSMITFGGRKRIVCILK